MYSFENSFTIVQSVATVKVVDGNVGLSPHINVPWATVK